MHTQLRLVQYLDAISAPACILAPPNTLGGKENNNTLLSSASVTSSSASSSSLSTPVILHANSSFRELCDLQYVSLDAHALPAFLHYLANPATFLRWLLGNSCEDQTPFVTKVITGEHEREVEWTATGVASFVVLTGVITNTITIRPGSSKETLDKIDKTPTSATLLQKNRQEARIERSPNLAGMTAAKPSVLSTANLIWQHSPMFTSGVPNAEMSRYMAMINWADSPLGPIETWDNDLRSTLNILFASSLPMALWWGPEYYFFYNSAYIPVAGKKHPSSFGRTGPEVWCELWDEISIYAKDSMSNGVSTLAEDFALTTDRNGFLEEWYVTWSYVPIKGADGKVQGLLNPCLDTSNRVISERRMKTLRELDSQTMGCKTTLDAANKTVKALSFNPFDCPFALIYFTEYKYRTTQPTSETLPEDRVPLTVSFELAAQSTIPAGHPLAPDSVELHLDKYSRGDDTVHVWPFRKMAEEKNIIELDGLLPQKFDGVIPLGHPEFSEKAVVFPLKETQSKELKGIIIIGLNSRRVYDAAYASFLQVAVNQISSSISNVLTAQRQQTRTEEMLQNSRDRMEFFHMVSHEIRTPLTLIMGPLADCTTDTSSVLSPRSLSSLKLATRNTKRLLRLVNSLLDFSKIEAGKMTACFRRTHLGKLTSDLASSFRSAIERSGVIYEVLCDEDPKQHEVWIDRDFWEKIVYNLIGNAFKFTLAGKIQVLCHAADDNENYLFTVKDTGTGIPTHEMHRIFERFHRIKGPQSRTTEGTGIGLALTKELVRLHGGVIDVISEFGVGSSFTVLIPYGRSHLDAECIFENEDYAVDLPIHPRGITTSNVDWGDETDVGSSSNHEPPSSSSGEPALPGILAHHSLILIADDNSDMRKFLKNILSSYYKIIECGNGQEALVEAQRHKPDLILSDAMMPILDGFGLLRVIRNTPALASTPFIILSAKAGDEAKVNGLTQGADDYIVKPFDTKELIARINSQIQLYLLRKELERRVSERTEELLESEKRYKTLASIAPVGIFRTDIVVQEGQFTFSNEKWWEITRHNRSLDQEGHDWIQAVAPSSRQLALDSWADTVSGGDASNIQLVWGASDDAPEEETIITWSIFTCQKNEDQVVSVMMVIMDISARVQLERRMLNASNARAQESEQLRVQQEMFIDMTAHELRNPLNGIYHNADIISEGAVRACSLLHSMEPTTQPDEANKLKTEALKEVENISECVETIGLCAKHQKRIADDVLQVSKMSMNLLDIANIPYKPLAEVEKVRRIFQKESIAKDVKILIEIGEEYRRLGVDTVLSDPTRLIQVLINFVSNAIRFTEKCDARMIVIHLDASSCSADTFHNPARIVPGTPNIPPADTPSSPLSPLSPGGGSIGKDDPALQRLFLLFKVRDTGVGLTEEEQANLFQRFQQASPKTHTEYGGTGLGLYISRKLIELLGGQISIESKKGTGTTIKFSIVVLRDQSAVLHTDYLPRSPRSTASDPERQTKSAPSLSLLRHVTTIEATTAVSHGASIHVLVVEDNIINQKVLTKQLSAAGYVSTVANNGQECLDLLKKYLDKEGSCPFQIILMDIEMPLVDGIEAATQIRAFEKEGKLKPKVPIIAVTGNARQEHKDRSLAAGMEAFFVKPYDKTLLFEQMALLTRGQSPLDDTNAGDLDRPLPPSARQNPSVDLDCR